MDRIGASQMQGSQNILRANDFDKTRTSYLYNICVNSQNDLYFTIFFIEKYCFTNLLCVCGKTVLMVTLDIADYAGSVVIVARKITC